MGLFDLLFGTKKSPKGSGGTAQTVNRDRQRLPHQRVLDRHFELMGQIEAAYRKRDQGTDFLILAIRACEEQIAISEEAAAAFRADGLSPLPAHTGFKQLAIIYEKQGNFSGAIDVAKRAKRERWMGDWDKRIARCQKRLR